MRKLTLIVIVLAGLYSGYWYIGASATERGASAQLIDLTDAGWDIAYGDLSTRGYPSRFDTTLTDFAATSPDGQTGVDIPFVQALSLSYQPNRVILAMPPAFTLTAGGLPMTVISDGLRASLGLQATPDLDLDTLTVESGPLQIAAQGTAITLTKGIAALRLSGPAPNQYDAYFDIDGFTLPDALTAAIDPRGTLPPSFDQITLDALVTLDGPVDRHAGSATPRPTALALRGTTITWGGLQVLAKGDLTIDRLGVPTGRISLTATGWRDMITLAVNAGLLDQGLANTAQNMGGLLGGGGADLTVPITFQNGVMSMGPLPLGPAPRFF